MAAGVAQPVEHLICNQRVGGSNPFASSSSSERSGGGTRQAGGRPGLGTGFIGLFTLTQRGKRGEGAISAPGRRHGFSGLNKNEDARRGSSALLPPLVHGELNPDRWPSG